MTRAFLCAVGSLTRFSFPDDAREVDAPTRRSAVAWFPAVGALIGLATAALVWALSLVLPIAVAVVVAIAIELWLTRAMHEGALAACFDAFGSTRSPEHALQRLDGGRLGAHGATALAVSLLVRMAAMASLETQVLLPAVATAAAAGRWILVGVMTSLPPLPGRVESADDTARGIDSATWMWSGVAVVPAFLWLAIAAPWPAALALLASFGTFLAAVQFFGRRLGGTNAEALGAVASATQTAVLVFASVRWSS